MKRPVRKNSRTLLMATTLVVLGFALLSLARQHPSTPAEPGASGRAAPSRDGVVAYYFHTTFRCSTCRKLEALSREALESGFAEELASGRLALRVVNVEDPGNGNFVQDFQLVTKSLVLVEYRDGKVVRWKNLPEIWRLVRNRDAFIRYVQEETRAFLGESR